MSGCVVDLVEATVDVAPVGWEESLRLVIRGEQGCLMYDLHVAPGQSLEDWRGQVHSASGRTRRFDPVRVELREVRPDGSARVTVHLEDLDGGGLADLRLLRRSNHAGPYTLRPSHLGARAASIRLRHGLAPSEVQDMRADRRWWFSASVEADTGLTVPHPWADGVGAAVPSWTDRRGLDLAAAEAVVSGLVRLPDGFDHPVPRSGETALARGAVDDAGALLTLHALTSGGPDELVLGGTATRPTLTRADGAAVVPGPGAPADVLSWMVHPVLQDRERVLVLSLTATRADPTRAAWAFFPLSPEVKVEPPTEDVEWRRVGAAAWLLLPPGTTSARLALHQPLRDAWGELPVPATLAPDASPAFVQDRPGQWRLVAFAGRPALTDRDRLAAEIDRRRALAGFPEPALPLHSLRLTGWDLAAALPALLADRAAVADIPQAPGQLRPLYRARRTGVVSEAEAAAILAAYARQGRIAAEVVLVSPGEADPGTDASRWTHALVRLQWQGEERWLDPGCRTCAPFTLRDDLRGHPALGVVDRTPASPPVTDTPRAP